MFEFAGQPGGCQGNSNARIMSSRCGGEAGGARVGKPRHSRIAVVASGGWISARIRIAAPQCAQRSTSIAKTRCMSSGHVSRRRAVEPDWLPSVWVGC